MTLPIPTAALSQHVIALGKTGSGKSSKLRVLVEHQLAHEHPVTIVDPKGDWWGLKSSADGRSQGFPIVIFGGEHADVPINEHSGAHVAELVATGIRSALIDLGGWMVGERTRFFVDFAGAYFRHIKGARTLVLPEVHNFAPQGKVMDPAAGKMLHWANRLASEGRGKGLTILADSQRPQKTHKDFVTSCETLIACRVIHKLDRDAIKDWIDGCADPVAGKQVLGELAQMQRADAWVWSPEIEFGPKRITWPMFKTFDSFKPQPERSNVVGWAAVDLDEVKAKLAAVLEEAKANDPKELRARIAVLERERALERVNPLQVVVDNPDTYQNGCADGFSQGRDAMAAEFNKRLTVVADNCTDVMSTLKSLKDHIEAARHYAETESSLKVSARPENPVRSGSPVRSMIPKGPISAVPRPAAPRARQIDERAPSDTSVAQRVLDGLAELEQMGAATPDRELVAFMANYSNIQSKGFKDAISTLKAADEIHYPQPGTIQLTAAGRRKANPSARPRSSAELQARICSMLGGATERALKPLIENYPKSLEREHLASLSGYGNIQSKGFKDAISRLKSLDFIHYPTPGSIAAKAVLFLEER